MIRTDSAGASKELGAVPLPREPGLEQAAIAAERAAARFTWTVGE